MDNIILGQYVDTDSFIHHLNAKTKFIAMIMIMISAFLGVNLVSYIILTILLLVVVFSIKVPLLDLLKMFRPVVFFVSFIALFNLLFSPQSGQMLFQFYFIKMSTGSLMNAFLFSYRVIIVFIFGTVFSITTKPIDFAYGFEDLISPLKMLRVPTAEIALMLSLTLRFIPILFGEMMTIQAAQMSRGADVENGKFLTKIKATIAMLIPLFIVSFVKSEKLALAMEARGFVNSYQRSRYRESKFYKRDYLVLAFVVSIVVIVTLFQLKVI